jgi:acyl-CoA synthetase (AMP-forming)/AMP-acid ligase II
LESVETALVAGPETNPELKENLATAANQPGLLLVRGPSVFSGYLPPPVGYASPASPFVEYKGKTWYRTGDLLSRDEEGVLTFRGRLKRFIKAGGEMISLPQIEETLLRALDSLVPDGLPGEQEGPLLAIEAVGPDGLITLFSSADISREQANRILSSGGLSGLYNIRQVIKVEKLPLLGTGKVDYRALAETGQEYGH